VDADALRLKAAQQVRFFNTDSGMRAMFGEWDPESAAPIERAVDLVADELWRREHPNARERQPPERAQQSLSLATGKAQQYPCDGTSAYRGSGQRLRGIGGRTRGIGGERSCFLHRDNNIAAANPGRAAADRFRGLRDRRLADHGWDHQ